jgi:hypothetical protein
MKKPIEEVKTSKKTQKPTIQKETPKPEENEYHDEEEEVSPTKVA